MTRHSMRLRVLRALGLLGLVALLPLPGCTHDLLQVTDPDIIPDVNTASGALALKNGVIFRLEQVTAGLGGNGPDNLFIYGGLLADEWRSGDTFVQRNDMDQRLFDPTNTFLAGPLRSLNRVRVEGRTAIDKLRAYAPTPVSNVGLMFALTAFVDNLSGEYYCNGIPLSFPNPDGTFSFGDPVSDDSMFALAAATADSALANRASADSVRVRQLASIVKARALLNRGQFAAAAAAVADDVTTRFRYNATYSVNAGQNEIWNLNTSIKRYSMGDKEGGNGLPFATATDPRIPRKIGGRVFDSATPLTAITEGIWDRYSPVAIATGVEARLIEAEATLKAGDAATWLAKLNQLRADAKLLPTPIDTSYRPVAGTTLAPLADPVLDTARVSLLFSERAFWMFSTGHPERALAEQQAHARGIEHRIGERRERRAGDRPVARVDWRRQELGVGPQLVELRKPGRRVACLERRLGFDQPSLDPSRDRDGAVAVPDPLRDRGERRCAIEHAAADLPRDAGVRGRSEGETVPTLLVAHRVALDAGVQVPDLVLPRVHRVGGVVAEPGRHVVRHRRGRRGELTAVEQGPRFHDRGELPHPHAVGARSIRQCRIGRGGGEGKHRVVGDRVPKRERAVRVGEAQRDAVAVVLPREVIDERREREHQPDVRNRGRRIRAQLVNRRPAFHAHAVERAQRSR